MTIGQKAMSGAFVLLCALALALPAYGQVEVEDLGFQNKAIEPGDAIPMDDTFDPAVLGSGVTVMRFTISDVDPQADDPSDVSIDTMTVHNLGTADENDIVEVLCMDEDGNAVAPVATPGAGPNPNIPFVATCDLGGFTIPDNGSETFEIAVRTAATDQLLDDDQNNSLQLRVTTRYSERMGSPPTNTDFAIEVTDSKPEFIYNGGINEVLEETYGVESLMPGEQGLVSRFTVCDEDSNEHNLVIDELTIKEGDAGTALFTDIASLEIFRVENTSRTQVGTLTPSVSSNRGSEGDFLLLPTSVFVQDDHCTTFEVEAQVSPYAFKGKLIQLDYQISAEEPVHLPINETVDPEVKTSKPTAIGKGLVGIGDAVILPQRDDGAVEAEVPLYVSGFQLPGFGALQVGTSGSLSYDPSVLRLKDIVPADPDLYDITIGEIDNRAGKATFIVRIDPSQTDNAVQNGTVAYFVVEGVGNAGDRTRMTLSFDDVKDANNTVLTSGVGTDSGLIEIVPPGDVDRDGSVAVNDSLLLGQQLLVDCEGLSDTQKRIADVADPQAPTDEVPTCGGSNPDLTSADVAAIASLALESGDDTSSSAVASGTESPVEALSVNAIQTTLTGGTLGITARGQGITGLELQMFNLAGSTVLNQTSTGTSLSARLQDSMGRPLANGVYLYVVTVQGADGQSTRSDVRKLVVLR